MYSRPLEFPLYLRVHVLGSCPCTCVFTSLGVALVLVYSRPWELPLYLCIHVPGSCPCTCVFTSLGVALVFVYSRPWELPLYLCIHIPRSCPPFDCQYWQVVATTDRSAKLCATFLPQKTNKKQNKNAWDVNTVLVYFYSS